ncbi:potassium transporter Kup [bacterium]|nr:potassium transporter Kup [bacterium]
MSNQENKHSNGIWSVCLASLGIVYGDIGTSPLYAFRECFIEDHGLMLKEASVLGVLSLIFWSLVTVISLKYMVFVLRADNNGEGGVLALSELCQVEAKRGKLKKVIIAAGLFGSALLYGDGVITPAISVLSAIEGLNVATPIFEDFIVPITIVILMGLFAVQKGGTAKIGKILGPVMLVWFSFLAILGVKGILLNPSVLKAISPYYALHYFVEFKTAAFVSMGAVFLVVTGGEALYADMGHFNKRPIRLAWFYLTLPALLLNYFGQGALLIQNPEAIVNPFYELVPRFLLYPAILLATCATVIASQAVISGVFSLTTQAIQLGYSPRFKIVHTSQKEIGQVYLPQINRIMCVATILLVLMFKSSTSLAAAYGIAVSLTMILTTLLVLYLAIKKWNWPKWGIVLFALFFVSLDGLFFSANALKFMDGGWFPLVVASSIFIMMTTWRKGRRLLAIVMKKSIVNISKLQEIIDENKAITVDGTAVFMIGNPDTLPPALIHNLRNNRVIHKTNIFLTFTSTISAYVPYNQQITILHKDQYYTRVLVKIGFRQEPKVPAILKRLQDQIPVGDLDRITYFIGRETLIPSRDFGLVFWRAQLFAMMAKNAQSATQFFEIPPDQVMEIGMQLKI